MDAKNRENIRAGLEVGIVEKHNQGSGTLTKGVVEEILTNSSFHPRGIKVRLGKRSINYWVNIYRIRVLIYF